MSWKSQTQTDEPAKAQVCHGSYRFNRLDRKLNSFAKMNECKVEFLPSAMISEAQQAMLPFVPSLACPFRFQSPAVCPPSRKRPRTSAAALTCNLSSPVEEQLRALGAHAAADLFYSALSSNGEVLNTLTCTDVISVFEEKNVRGVALSRIAQRLGLKTLVDLNADDVRKALDLLHSLGLSEEQRNRVLTQRPDVLRETEKMTKAIEALRDAGLTQRDLKAATVRWPGALLLDSARIECVVNFLMSSSVGMPKEDVRPLLKRALWILVYDVDKEMAPSVLFLRNIGIEDVSVVIKAAPLVSGMSTDRMREVVEFLQEVGLGKEDVQAICRSFPPILTCHVDVLREGYKFLKEELLLKEKVLHRVIRAFPTILTLDLEESRSIVIYFKERGVRDVGRIVKRLPPVLGYDLEEVQRKMLFVENAGLGVRDVLKFPALFSYDFERRIVPRILFLLAKNVSVQKVGLNVVLSLTDTEFCKRLGQGWTDGEYTKFKRAIIEKRKLERTVRETDEEKERERGKKKRFHPKLSRLPWNELK